MRFCLNSFVPRCVWRFFLAIILLGVLSTLNAQSSRPSSQDSPASEQEAAGDQDGQIPNGPDPGSSTYGMKQVGKDFLKDQKTIWTSPFGVQRNDLKWIVPLVAVSGTMITLDRRIADQLRDLNFKETSGVLSNLGGPTNFVTAGLFYSIGSLAKNERARETGLLGLRAAGNAWGTVQGLKLATNRERPDNDSHGSRTHQGHGGFWNGGASFPSGHAASTWALATVIAKQYPDKPVVGIGFYALATAVSLSRLTGDRHFASDVLVGSIIGYLIGRYVVKDRRSRK